MTGPALNAIEARAVGTGGTETSEAKTGVAAVGSPADAAGPPVWRQADGTPIACREKLRVLEENRAELVQVMQDAFEDAVLMGVDEAAMREHLAATVRGLRSPKRG